MVTKFIMLKDEYNEICATLKVQWKVLELFFKNLKYIRIVQFETRFFLKWWTVMYLSSNYQTKEVKQNKQREKERETHIVDKQGNATNIYYFMTKCHALSTNIFPGNTTWNIPQQWGRSPKHDFHRNVTLMTHRESSC